MATRLTSRLRFAPPRVEVEPRSDGSILLRSPLTLEPYPRAVGDWLVDWAQDAPDRRLPRRARRRRLAQDQLPRGARRSAPDRRIAACARARRPKPVALLSDNCDRPRAAYARRDARRRAGRADLARVFADVEGLRQAEGASSSWSSRAWCGPPTPRSSRRARGGRSRRRRRSRELLAVQPTGAASTRHSRGRSATRSRRSSSRRARPACRRASSTRTRMLCSNQQSWAQVWPFLEDRPPVIVDWLPWNHTFGGNHNFNMVLRNGGTLYIDGGKPVPGLIETTARNLRECRRRCTSTCRAASTCCCRTWNPTRSCARASSAISTWSSTPAPRCRRTCGSASRNSRSPRRGGDLAMLSAWGSTETAPMATCVHFPIERAGVIGLPAPGCEIKLVPSGGKLEARVRGPNVTPGYYRRDDLTRAAFDDEGFYRIGDALRFADPGDAVARPGVRRPRRRGLQALDRHVGARGRGTRAADRRGRIRSSRMR